MIVNKVEQKVKVGIDTVIQYQFLTYCFFRNIALTKLDLKFLTALAKLGDVKLMDFCSLMVERKDFKNTKSVINEARKLEKAKLIIKDGQYHKYISINKDIKVQSTGYILLDFKIFGSESEAL